MSLVKNIGFFHIEAESEEELTCKSEAVEDLIDLGKFKPRYPIDSPKSSFYNTMANQIADVIGWEFFDE